MIRSLFLFFPFRKSVRKSQALFCINQVPRLIEPIPRRSRLLKDADGEHVCLARTQETDFLSEDHRGIDGKTDPFCGHVSSCTVATHDRIGRINTIERRFHRAREIKNAFCARRRDSAR